MLWNNIKKAIVKYFFLAIVSLYYIRIVREKSEV